jgi:hypothetical protein
MTDPTPPQDDAGQPENEVLRAAREAKAQAEKAETGAADPATGKKPKVGWKTGVGIGVGSAALLAALLFANRKK